MAAPYANEELLLHQSQVFWAPGEVAPLLAWVEVAAVLLAFTEACDDKKSSASCLLGHCHQDLELCFVCWHEGSLAAWLAGLCSRQLGPQERF
jgi:hypothetical protein